MNYESIAKGIITSAVKTHLKNQIKEHTRKTAAVKAKLWLTKNKQSLDDMVEAAVFKALDEQKKAIAQAAAKAISLKAPVKRRSGYY